MPSLKDILDALNTTWPVALVAFISCATLLGSEYAGLPYMSGVSDAIKASIFIGGVFSGSIVIVATARFVGGLVARPFHRRARNRALADHAAKLDSLPPEERYVLGWAFAKNQQVFLAPLNHNALEPLIAKRFVNIVGGTHSILDWPHHIPDHIWERLAEIIPRSEIPANLESPFSRWN